MYRVSVLKNLITPWRKVHKSVSNNTEKNIMYLSATVNIINLHLHGKHKKYICAYNYILQEFNL